MGLANLLTVPPGQWEDFWFNNWIDHQDIQQAVNKLKGLNNEVYNIDPWNDDAKDSILQRHQFFHNDMNTALGLNGQDLTSIDFKNEEALKGWVWQHYQEHQSVRLLLTGI